MPYAVFHHQGFEGRVCEIDVNECKSAQCLNGGSCIDKVNSYSCECMKGKLLKQRFLELFSLQTVVILTPSAWNSLLLSGIVLKNQHFKTLNKSTDALTSVIRSTS